MPSPVPVTCDGAFPSCSHTGGAARRRTLSRIDCFCNFVSTPSVRRLLGRGAGCHARTLTLPPAWIPVPASRSIQGTGRIAPSGRPGTMLRLCAPRGEATLRRWSNSKPCEGTTTELASCSLTCPHWSSSTARLSACGGGSEAVGRCGAKGDADTPAIYFCCMPTTSGCHHTSNTGS